MPRPFAAALLLFLATAAPALAHDARLHTAVDRRPLSAPAKGGLFACRLDVMGPALARPWIAADGTVDPAAKPTVPGEVAWAGAVTATVEGDRRVIRANGLPTTPTGTFPVPRGTEAHRYDPNPNRIAERTVLLTLPATPTVAPTPGCLPFGTIGVTVTGAAIFNALDADRRDAVANEIFDACGGHPAPGGVYHIHGPSPCLPRAEAGRHAPVVGWALDGFAIHGAEDADGQPVAEADLDECHGHVGPAPQPDGTVKTVYHYHLTGTFPYTLGCFRGAVDPALLRRGPGG